MSKIHPRQAARLRRKKHIRKIVRGTAERPRLCVFRTSKHIYAQLIDDDSGNTLASASSLNHKFKKGATGGNIAGATAVGEAVAKAAKKKKVTSVVFDRNGYLYHGRVAALAQSAREAGLHF